MSNTIFAYDTDAREVLEMIDLKEVLPEVNFMLTRMVQCDKILFYTKGSDPINMMKLEKVNSASPTLTEMCSLQRNLEDFSLANFFNKFLILTGGAKVGTYYASKEVFSYNIKQNLW